MRKKIVSTTATGKESPEALINVLLQELNTQNCVAPPRDIHRDVNSIIDFMKNHGGVNIGIIGDETYSVAFLNKEDYEKVGKLALKTIGINRKKNPEKPKPEDIIIYPKISKFAYSLFCGLIIRDSSKYDQKDSFSMTEDNGFSFVFPAEIASNRINEASSR